MNLLTSSKRKNQQPVYCSTELALEIDSPMNSSRKPNCLTDEKKNKKSFWLRNYKLGELKQEIEAGVLGRGCSNDVQLSNNRVQKKKLFYFIFQN